MRCARRSAPTAREHLEAHAKQETVTNHHLRAEHVVDWATRGGSRALGLDSAIGSLEAGKRADVVIHTVDRPEAHPRWADPVDNLVFYGQTATVDSVLVDGEVVLEGGRFTRFDAADAYRTIDAEAERFENVLGRRAFATWPIVD